ncbi:MAG: deaminase [Candidatus Leucobacter sulfamidivorax]|nr:deaminase [Candidatus Leucobacter sulfamidivorax]
MSDDRSEGDAARIVIDLFVTLDGVAQAPGAPEEDPSGGFRFGGWQAPFPDPRLGETIMSGIRSMDALLLGRRTYDIFAGYWPQQLHTEIGRTFQGLPKYVATRNPGLALEWEGSERIGADLAVELGALRRRHREIHVIGSVDLVQTLVSERLFDEMRLWVYPIVLGEGSRVFPGGAAPTSLALLEPPVVGDSGAVLLRYGLLPGVPQTGTIEA